MPDTPAAAGFLTDEEKEWALRRMRIDARGSTEVDVDDEKFSWCWARMALLAPQTYLSAFIWFFLLVPLYVSYDSPTTHFSDTDRRQQSFSLFLPSIIAGMGYKSTTAQLFTVPPNMAAFLTVIGTAYASDRLRNRGYFIIGGCVLGICGYVMLIVATTNAVRYAGTFLVAIGVFQGSPMLMVRTVSCLFVAAWLIGNKGLGIEQSRSALCKSCRNRPRHFHCKLLRFHWNLHLPAARRAEIHIGAFSQPWCTSDHNNSSFHSMYIFGSGEQEER